MTSDRGILRASNMSLESMIMRAYGLKKYQLRGPDWLESLRFDMAARLPADIIGDPSDRHSPSAQMMMRKMLADRFKLIVHVDHTDLPVYGLTVATDGIRFPESQEVVSHSTAKNGHYTGAVTMADFVEYLEWPADLPVVDMTALKGIYDITFDWKPAVAADNSQSNDAIWDGLRAAVEAQLGLRIRNRRAQIEVLVIDHVERAPTDN